MFRHFYDEQKLYVGKEIGLQHGKIDFESTHNEIEPQKSFAKDLEFLVNSIKACQMEVLFFNHSKEEFGVPVVHAIIPGMHFSGNRI